MLKNYSILFILLQICFFSGAQPARVSVSAININTTDDFTGFDLLHFTGKKVFIIAEDVHNRIHIPQTTLKFLMYLHTHAGTRTLAIEGGSSTAYLINRYMETQDTVLLREIIRHTFFWSREHYAFLKALAAWNNSLPFDERISVQSADIELKQESVVLAVNELLLKKDIAGTEHLQGFRDIFVEKEKHRQQYQALNTFYYYDKQKCKALTESVLHEMDEKSMTYQKIFGSHFDLFKQMMRDLLVLYEFDYKADFKFKFRDDIIYRKLQDFNKISPNGFLYVVGAKHTRPGASSGKLRNSQDSPFKGQVIVINTTGKKKNGKYQGAKVVTKISQAYPHVFNTGLPVLIRNDGHDEDFTQVFDYSLAFEDVRHVTPFVRSYQ